MFCGGAKGAFLAFCAALMLRRDHDDLHREGGRMLAPAGYYQSLRLIPPVFGGSIDVVGELTRRERARLAQSHRWAGKALRLRPPGQQRRRPGPH